MEKKLLPELNVLAHALMEGNHELSPERRELLDAIAAAISGVSGEIHLNFICVHNSRRSMISQAWAQAAACYHGLGGIHCVSGGTAVTAFHPNAVNALRRQGFRIDMKSGGANPVYEARYAPDAPSLEMYSKRFEDSVPLGKPFIAMMVCSTADSWCPVVPGAIRRFQFNYSDPGVSDGTDIMESVYDGRSKEIASEMLYLFSQVRDRKV